jgi:hypothetical protein
MEKFKVSIKGHQIVATLEKAKDRINHLEKVQPSAGRKKKHFIPLGTCDLNTLSSSNTNGSKKIIRKS